MNDGSLKVPHPNLSADTVAPVDSGQLSRLYDALTAMLARSKARLRCENNDGPCQDGV